MNNKEYIIKPTGEVILRTITETELDASGKIMEIAKRHHQSTFKNVAELKSGNVVHVSVIGTVQFYVTIGLTALRFQCPFSKTGEGILSPSFRAEEGSQEMDLVWTMGDAISKSYPMRMFLLLQITKRSDGSFETGKQYFFAMNSSGNKWRLPVSNVYDHCELCAGSYPVDKTLIGTAQQCFDQFYNSKWNSDLSKSSEDNTEKVFRFKLTNDSIQTIAASVKDWTKCCLKVANSELDQAIV